jgi:OOP family OmpA-OmpF porin
LKETARARLVPLLDRLKRDPDAKLVVEGHTDLKGGEAYNVMLSYARARSVIAWLETEGVEKRQMTALAAGTSQPRDSALVVAENRMALLRVEGVRPCLMEGAKTQ